MAHTITGATLTESWLAATEFLHTNRRETFDLIVETANPAPVAADPAVIATLDRFLDTHEYQRVHTVANTIFPVQLARTARDRQALYQRYQTILPRLRQCSKKNSRGLYFARLLDYPLRPDRSNSEPMNQLETIIQDLQAELARPNPLRFIYEAQIFAPGKDRRPIGFPCMSSLSFQLDGRQLRLSVTYRNQYYVQKALGNFLGLAHLQRFVAGEVGLDQGPLTVHAFHAQIDPDVGQRDTERLISACHRSGHASPLPVAVA